MTRVLPFFLSGAIALALGCAAEEELPEPAEGTAVELEAPAVAKAPAVTEALPPAEEGRLPGDLEALKKRILATKGEPPETASLPGEGDRNSALEKALAELPSFVEAFVSALAAEDAEKINQMIMDDGDVMEIFAPSIAGIVSQRSREWLPPVQARLAGQEVKKVELTQSEDTSATVGGSSVQSSVPGAYRYGIAVVTAEREIQLLLKQAFYGDEGWKIFTMELAGAGPRRP